MRIGFCAGLAAWLCLAGLSQPVAARQITLADLAGEVTLWDAAVSLSPDGRRAALIVTRADLVDNRFVKTLLLVDTTTGAQRELAPGRIRLAAPQWSPDGKQLAWLDAAAEGQRQVYVADADAGVAATALTSVPEGVGSFKWSPDGAAIAFTAADPAPRPRDLSPHVRSFEVTAAHDFLSTSAVAPEHLWVVPARGGTPRRLTSGTASVDGFEWLGGEDLAVLVQVKPNLTVALHRVNIASGRTTVLIPAGGDQPVTALLPASPDGSLLAYLRSRGPESGFRSDSVAVMPAAGGDSRDITAATDRNFYATVWRPGGDSVIALAGDGVRDALWLQPLQGPARRLNLGAVTEVRHLTTSRSGALAFVGFESRRAGELYFMASPSEQPRRLTHFNDSLAALDFGPIGSVTWQLDGFQQSGVLIQPPGFRQGHKYPLVLDIHGGPAAHYSETLDPFHELLAAQGWLVFCPNYRGSDTAGDAYRRGIVNDAGDGPARDVMAGIKAVEALGIVDSNRIAVSGWSYGGYLTAWLTTHYPQRWRVAVAGAAVTDFVDQYALSDLNAWYGLGLGGSPWLEDNARRYREQSPIHYAGRSRTPTLLLAVTGDRRVPIVQSYKFYRALQDNGVPVRFIAYPVDGHFPEDPLHQRDIHRRWLEWIAEHFGPATAAPD